MTTLPEAARELDTLLRLRTPIVGIKWFRDAAELQNVARVRKFGHTSTFCQVLHQSRHAGWTMGVEDSDLTKSGCASIFGLREPLPELMSGEYTKGVWFRTQEDASAHQHAIPRVPRGVYSAIAFAPVVGDKFEPDVIVVYGLPAQIILFVNGLQWEGYQRFQFNCVGEASCSDSIAECFNTGQPSLGIPCFGERRYGHVANDEIMIAVKPAQLQKAVVGLKGLSAAGLRFPIPPYGLQADPAAGLAKSYADKWAQHGKS